MQVWKNSLKGYKIGSYDHSEHKYYLYKELAINRKYYSFTYTEDQNNIIEDYDGKEYALTEENRKILLDKTEEFQNEFDNAYHKYEKITVFRSSDYYFKRINLQEYHVFLREDNSVTYFKESLEKILKDCYSRFCGIVSFVSKNDEDFQKKIYEEVINPFLPSKDLYLALMIKYVSNIATKEDVDMLNALDDGNRFFVEKEVYGVEDITDIKNVTLSRRGSMFGYKISYKMEIQIKGKYYTVIYFPHTDNLKIKSYEGQINLTKEMQDKIKVLTGETEENIRTRKLMQLGNFLYCYDGGITRYSLEQQNKVFNDLSKVSLEDIKALPSHWQAKLSTPLLYDWLKCAGYSGDTEANEFVENLVKTKKSGK
jgi:hypothetical protein